MKKYLIAGLTAGTLALGLGAATPANAFVYFGVGPGWGYGYRPWHPHYAYGWHPGPHCGWVSVKKKWHGRWHWKRVWRCW